MLPAVRNAWVRAWELNRSPCLGNSSVCVCLGRERRGSSEVCDPTGSGTASRTRSLEARRGRAGVLGERGEGGWSGWGWGAVQAPSLRQPLPSCLPLGFLVHQGDSRAAQGKILHSKQNFLACPDQEIPEWVP